MPQTFTPEDFAKVLRKAPFSAVRGPLMHRVTLTLLAASQQRTPVRTGHLRRSETTEVENGGMRGFVGTNVVYAPFVHARVPFFAQAITDTRAEIDHILREAGDEYFALVIK